MGYISVDQAKDGMVLAEDVKDVNSRLLLPKGSEIQPQHIRMFRMWGIGEVNIVGQSDDGSDTGSESDPAFMEKTAMEVKQLFQFNDLSQATVKELFGLSLLHRVKEKTPGASKRKIAQDSSAEANRTSDARDSIRKKNIVLPEIPSIVYELNEVIADPFSSANDIAQIVSKSPSLSSLILKIVNSAFYGFPSKIGSISRAVALIGSKEISSLGMGITTMKLFKDIPKEVIDLKSFFKHSLACGVISRLLAANLNVQHTEQLFVAGLLHDIGRVILFKYFPQQSKSALCEATQSGKLLFSVEDHYLGCRHTHIGKDLFKKWKLPYGLESSTYYHHRPSGAPDPIHATIVHLADFCAHGFGLGSSGEPYVPSLDIPSVEALSLAPGVLKNVLHQAVRQLDFLDTVFNDQE